MAAYAWRPAAEAPADTAPPGDMGSSGVSRGIRLTFLDPLARATLAAAAALACIVARRRAEHWPIAIALVLASALDAIRQLAPMSASLSELLYVAHPALSIWCALRVLGSFGQAAAIISAVAWPVIYSEHPFAISLAAQLYAAGCWLLVQRRRATTSDACALMLLAGDAAALLGPLAWDGRELWWIVQGQGLLVALALGAVQARAISAE